MIGLIRPHASPDNENCAKSANIFFGFVLKRFLVEEKLPETLSVTGGKGDLANVPKIMLNKRNHMIG
jgi:hypothetical protein